MDKTTYEAYRYSCISVVVFGILGNTLVIISLLGQRKLLKGNYYFLVLHLAICNLGYLVVVASELLKHDYVIPSDYSLMYCLMKNMNWIFGVAGVYMMLLISVLRYRATVHPLTPAISRRKVIVACALGYVVGLIAGYGISIPLCFMQWNEVTVAYNKFLLGYTASCFYLIPTIFIAIVYHGIGRALVEQHKHMKRVCSNATKRRYVQNRRIFLVCLGTVLCWGGGSLPEAVCQVWYIFAGQYQMKYAWIYMFGIVLGIAGSNSANPFIYGTLDRKLLTFWKVCSKKSRRSLRD